MFISSSVNAGQLLARQVREEQAGGSFETPRPAEHAASAGWVSTVYVKESPAIVDQTYTVKDLQELQEL